MAKTLYAPLATQFSTPQETTPTIRPFTTSGPPESPLQADVVPLSPPVAGLPAQTMWPLTNSPPKYPAQVVSDWTGSVAVFRVSEMSPLVELVRPQP